MRLRTNSRGDEVLCNDNPLNSPTNMSSYDTLPGANGYVKSALLHCLKSAHDKALNSLASIHSLVIWRILLIREICQQGLFLWFHQTLILVAKLLVCFFPSILHYLIPQLRGALWGLAVSAGSFPAFLLLGILNRRLSDDRGLLLGCHSSYWLNVYFDRLGMTWETLSCDSVLNVQSQASHSGFPDDAGSVSYQEFWEAPSVMTGMPRTAIIKSRYEYCMSYSVMDVETRRKTHPMGTAGLVLASFDVSAQLACPSVHWASAQVGVYVPGYRVRAASFGKYQGCLYFSVLFGSPEWYCFCLINKACVR